MALVYFIIKIFLIENECKTPYGMILKYFVDNCSMYIETCQ